MKIERIDNGIYVIYDFLTEGEEVAINLLLKGAVWRYNWPNYEELLFVRPCWHVFISVFCLVSKNTKLWSFAFKRSEVFHLKKSGYSVRKI